MIRSWFLARHGLRQHALSAAIAAGSLALANGLALSTWALQARAREAFTAGRLGFDGVAGPRGSQLQLVLSAVFLLEPAPGTLRWEEYRKLAGDPRVERAVPLVLGDSWSGFRLVGTTPERFQLGPGGALGFAAGRPFDPARAEAVVGSFVAERGLPLGATFRPAHGLEEGGHEHDEELTVVGVLAPTNGPLDRAILVPLEAMLHLSGHVLRGGPDGRPYEPVEGQPIPDEVKEVSAVLLRLRGIQAGFQLQEELERRGRTITFAWPVGRVVAGLFDRTAWVARVLELVAGLVLLVAGASVLTSLYNTMRERRRELAVLRALGARRSTVFAAVLLEAVAIAALGAVCGLLLHLALVAGAAAVVRAETGVHLAVLAWHPALAAVPLLTVLLGALAGVLPAWQAYTTDVAEGLAPH